MYNMTRFNWFLAFQIFLFVENVLYRYSFEFGCGKIISVATSIICTCIHDVPGCAMEHRECHTGNGISILHQHLSSPLQSHAGGKGGSEGGRERRMEGGKEGGREGGREGRTEGGKEGGREGRWEERRKGGREGRREGEKDGGRMEGGREGGRETKVISCGIYFQAVVVDTANAGSVKITTPIVACCTYVMQFRISLNNVAMSNKVTGPAGNKSDISLYAWEYG